MNQGINQYREKNPRENANIFSQLLFLYTAGIFRKGLKRDLQKEDVYEVLNSCKASKLGDKLQNVWEIEKLKAKPWILRPLFKTFGCEWVICGLLLVVFNTIVTILKPLAVGKVVAYFSKDQTHISKESAYMYATLLMGMIVANTIFGNNYMMYIQHLIMKIRIACSSLIYRKALKLSPTSLKKMTSGKVVTLLTKDVHGLDFSVNFVHTMVMSAIQVVVTAYIMYLQMGMSTLVGVAVLILLVPLNVFLGKLVSNLSLKTATKTDERVRIVQEILSAIKIIKMYTWEQFFTKAVNGVRNKEVKHLRTIYYIRALALSLGDLTIRCAVYFCIITYIATGHQVTAEKAYVVIGCFDSLRMLVTILLPFGIAQIAHAAASLKRITEFLNSNEVEETISLRSKNANQNAHILLQEVSASFELKISILSNLSLEIKPGLTAITGPIGCGKSTLLKLFLKDIPVSQGSVTINGSIAYASQQPWLFASTVKQNILFGEPLDETRYQTVINVCALRKDLESFAQGDATSVTDNGLNLSGGQKARINLARAVYKDADIYLLDDALSSVDTHVGKYIFKECVQEFLKNKLTVLVTHQTEFLKKVEDIILLNESAVQYRGNYKNMSQYNEIYSPTESTPHEFVNEDVRNSETVENNDENANESNVLLEKSKNMDSIKSRYDEHKVEGGVTKQIYKDYIIYAGGFLMVFILLAVYVLAQTFSSCFDYFVSYWVDLEESVSTQRLNGTINNGTEYKEDDSFRSNISLNFSFLIIGATMLIMTRSFLFFICCTKASINIHNAIVNNIMKASMIFFDNNLLGNIINRFARDLGIIDELLPAIGFDCARTILLIIGALIVVSSVNPTFLIPSACLGVIIYKSQNYYLCTGRSLKRLEGATRSPVIGHLTASMEGLTTIRASKAQIILAREFDKYQDTFNSTAYMQLSTTRAFGFYLESFCSLYIIVIILGFLTFSTDTDGGKVGLAITQALSLSGVLQWGGRQCAEFETLMTSVERALEYTKVEMEVKSGDKPVQWPSNGKIEYNEVSLRYSSTGERVLKEINFIIESKQKIGVVGRTGAGKSSIIAVLFRLYDFKGSIFIDGVDINTIDMDCLRSNIAIIPQDPLLFTGTLRNNLDPNNNSTDKDLWDALEEVKMKNYIASLESGLDSKLSEGASRMSIGQRQLLCLTRAILRKNKIIILDEATANIDPQTDSLIQRAIRRNFSNCTVITVAHRLHTIMDSDKVLVMDSGRVVEYNDPMELLKNPKGLFYGMVVQAGLLR